MLFFYVHFFTLFFITSKGTLWKEGHISKTESLLKKFGEPKDKKYGVAWKTITVVGMRITY